MKKIKITAALILLITCTISVIPPLSSVSQNDTKEDKNIYQSLWKLKVINDSAEANLSDFTTKTQKQVYNFYYYKDKINKAIKNNKKVVIKEVPKEVVKEVIREVPVYIYKDEEGRVTGYDTADIDTATKKKTFWQKLFKRKQ